MKYTDEQLANWEKVCSILRADMPAVSFKAWIEPLELLSVTADEVAVRCSDPKSNVEYYRSKITRAVQAVFGRSCSLKIVRSDT